MVADSPVCSLQVLVQVLVGSASSHILTYIHVHLIVMMQGTMKQMPAPWCLRATKWGYHNRLDGWDISASINEMPAEEMSMACMSVSPTKLRASLLSTRSLDAPALALHCQAKASQIPRFLRRRSVVPTRVFLLLPQREVEPTLLVALRLSLNCRILEE